ncbi:SCO-spondin-like [Gigantopelta aegis]|uniref:SCO-spondin-like n=1 Tax=Gigantopelta aegis TaxID=1735272 RepID=UPI001B887B80|nr:SCO-spondin-like [Gigantopelta aegis]
MCDANKGLESSICSTECPTSTACLDNEEKSSNCTTWCDSCRNAILDVPCVPIGCTDGTDEACVCVSGYKRDRAQTCVQEPLCECYDESGAVHDKNTVIRNNETCLECSCNSSNVYSCVPIPDCCSFSEWGIWSRCDSSCGVGTQQRTRTVVTGENCDAVNSPDIRACDGPCECHYQGQVYQNGDTFTDESICKICVCKDEVTNCTETLVVDGGYGMWSSWNMTGCEGDKMCVDYKKTRTRQCNDPEPKCGGSQCVEPSTNTQPCSDTPCCYPKTTDWTDCSKPCYNTNESQGTRSRTKFYPIAGCGQPEMEVEECGEPCDCVANHPWSTWSTCDDRCGQVAVNRTRGTSSDPDCSSLPDTDFRMCFSHNCECTEPDTVYTNSSTCEQTCESVTPSADCGNVVKSGCVCTGDTYKKDGKCVPRADCFTCLMNGTVHENNSVYPSPSNGCMECRCSDGKEDCYKSCTDQVTCLPTEEMVHDGCCYKCQLKPGLCGRKYQSVSISVDNCTTSHNVSVPYCEGTCDTGQSNIDPLTGAPTYTCICCTPTTTMTIQQNVTCSDGSLQQVNLQEIQACSCTSCANPV